MPRTPEEFNDYVAKELRTGDKRMNTLTDKITAVKLEQAEFRRLACSAGYSRTRTRAHRDGKLFGKITMPVIDLLFFWQGPGHCKNAYIKEFSRKNYPSEYRPPNQPVFTSRSKR